MHMQSTQPTVIEYKGIKFRRYPNSKQWSHRVYFRPHIGYCAKGVGALHQEIWKDAHGEIPDGHHIHHIDENPFNNDISNLGCITKEDHAEKHAFKKRGIFTQQQKDSLPKAVIEAAKWHSTPEGLAWHSKNGKVSWSTRKTHTVKCVYCGIEYQSYFPKRAMYCSHRCNRLYGIKMEKSYVH
jgi:HNH endonuclease